jgi:hypothetical protein
MFNASKVGNFDVRLLPITTVTLGQSPRPLPYGCSRSTGHVVALRPTKHATLHRHAAMHLLSSGPLFIVDVRRETTAQ